MQRFGAVYDDGYGINCVFLPISVGLSNIMMPFSADLAAPDMIKFGIESKLSSPLTSTASLKKAILDSLYDIQAICAPSDVVTTHNIRTHL